MNDSLIQFFLQAWRGFALLGGLLVLAAAIAWNNARMRRNKREKQREEQDEVLVKQHPRKKVAQTEPSLFEEDEADDFFIPAGGSIFDNEDLFSDDANDDPLAELHALDAEVGQEQAFAQSTSQKDDDDAVDLASLLVGMVDEPDEPKNYHTISEAPVSVKLTTKRMALATELLSIFRDEHDSRLLVQIGDVGYRTLVDDAQAKKTFTSIMKELSGIVLNPDDNPPDDSGETGIALNTMSPKPLDVRISSGGDTSARELISILRDEADGRLIIQIGNTGYRTLADNTKAKTGFSKIMKELSEAVTTPDDNPPVKAKSRPSPPPVQATRKSRDDEDDVVLPGDIRVPKMDDLPDAFGVGRFGQMKIKKVKPGEKVEDINIAEAIDAYLQYKITQTPAMQNRGIRIWSAFGGGVRIEVGGKGYEFVDEVEDPDARKFIQQAINEWQDRH